MSYEVIWDSLARADAMTNVFGRPDRKTSLDEFDAGGQAYADVLRRLIAPGAIVLDLGCGPGRVEKFLAPHCGTLYAADISQEMLSLAAERLKGADNVRLQKLDGFSLRPLADDMFDFAWSVLVLQHMEKEDAFTYLRELNRVLRPGGRVFLQFPNLRSKFYFEGSFLVYVDTHDRSPVRVRPYTVLEVERFMQAAGFGEIDIREGGASLLSPDEITVVARRPGAAQPARAPAEAIATATQAGPAFGGQGRPAQEAVSIGVTPLSVGLVLSDKGGISRIGLLAALRKKAHELVIFYVNQLAGRVAQFRAQVSRALDDLNRRVEQSASQKEVFELQERVQRLEARIAEPDKRPEQ